jgi:glycosyltransferase involved in cell wall biosynthesis
MLITFVVATLNASDALPSLLKSLGAQTCKDFEVLVADGGSQDRTLVLLDEAARSLPLRVVSHADRGIYDAWNRCLGEARGEWVWFLGADDRLSSPHSVADMAAVLEGLPDRIRIAYARVRLVSTTGVSLEELGAPWERCRSRFREVMCVPHPATVQRRSLFAEHGAFDPGFRIAGDYEWLLRELKRGEAAFVPKVVVDMRFGGTSSQPGRFITSLLEVRKAQAMNGVEGLRLRWWLALGRAAVRRGLAMAFGEGTARTMMDIGRRLRGLPPLWTRIE